MDDKQIPYCISRMGSNGLTKISLVTGYEKMMKKSFDLSHKNAQPIAVCKERDYDIIEYLVLGGEYFRKYEQ